MPVAATKGYILQESLHAATAAAAEDDEEQAYAGIYLIAAT